MLNVLIIALNHTTAVEFDWIKLNTGVDEKLLSPKALMRTEW